MNYKQNEKINQVKESTLVVGIDIGSTTQYGRAFDWRGIELGKVFPFSNSREGFESFKAWMQRLQDKYKKSDVIVGIEPTGHYWFDLGAYLEDEGILLVMVNPYAVKQSKTRDTYVAYRKAGYSKKFLAEHESEITIHKAAKSYFIVPIVLTIALPSIFVFVISFAPDAASDFQKLLDMLPAPNGEYSQQQQIFSLILNQIMPSFFLIIPIMASSVMAASSFVGEKEKHTLETLLYSPLSLGQLFQSKILAGNRIKKYDCTKS